MAKGIIIGGWYSAACGAIVPWDEIHFAKPAEQTITCPHCGQEIKLEVKQ